MDAFEILVVAALLLIVGLGAIAISVNMSAGRRCLAAGYPHASVTYAMEAYCVRRVDQTDIVVPIDRAEASPPQAP